MASTKPALEDMERAAQSCLDSRLQRVEGVEVETTEASYITDLPVYEVTAKAKIRGWVSTGPSRYRLAKGERLLRLQVAAQDGRIIGVWMEKNNGKHHS
ncbi:MAG: hypothetical protein SVY53_06990 [Chloroflexota bacterium]|nr:hypothetical protein [Chloroflexota bacterium]